MLRNVSFKTILKKVMNMKMSLPQFIRDRFVSGLVLDNGNTFEANGTHAAGINFKFAVSRNEGQQDKIYYRNSCTYIFDT